jgi:hypothetical protein
VAELPCQRREGGLPGAAGRDVFGVVFDGVVEQCGACYVGVGDPVVGDDPDGDPEQVVSIRFTLPPVLDVQSGRQRQRGADPGAICSRELRDLDEQPFAQAGFAVHGGDRMQRHAGHQSPFRCVEPGSGFGRRLRSAICYHGRLRLILSAGIGRSCHDPTACH